MGPNTLVVLFAAPPARPSCTEATIAVREVGSKEWLQVTAVRCPGLSTKWAGRLAANGTPGTKLNLLPPTEVVVSELRGGAKYESMIVAHNRIGSSPGSPDSDAVECERGEVEVTGGRTWAERDAEARKRSLDVTEYDSPPPPEKHVKQDPSGPQSQSSASASHS